MDLSVIIPVLNEADSLPGLLEDLARQQQVDYEVIVVDGGSADDTVAVANDCFARHRPVGRCLTSERGRGKQLNTGAKSAGADWLLFLHADSRIEAPLQLNRALTALKQDIACHSSEAVVGRFGLKFDLAPGDRCFAYYYYENKARLDRSGCFHGDQGMLLKASYFREVGPFRIDLPVMEDTSLVEKIRLSGRWLLLPGEIITSSRRFAVEGVKERQTLNALMMNFRAIGWDDFFKHAPEVYNQQNQAERLDLRPFFHLINRLLGKLTFRQRWRVWIATGGYVRSQAWQIGFMFDCKRAYHDHLSVAARTVYMDWCDRWFDPATNHIPGRLTTALLVRFWFVLRRLC